MKGILTQIENRKGLKAKKIIGSDIAMEDDLIDAGMIEKTIKGMLNKNYEGNDDQYKKDKIRIDKMIKKYRESDEEDAESNLKEIDFLFKKLKSKMQTLEYRDE